MDNISYKLNDDTLVIFIKGKLDTGNAQDTEKAIDDITQNNGFKKLIIDICELTYISSAGLRVILRVKKSIPDMYIINASSEVYDIFEMTGFTEMISISKAMRTLCVDGCKILGKGAKGTVYRYNDETIVKVYSNPESLPEIKNERALARKAFVLGIPTAISYDVVKVGDSYGSVFELLDAKSYTELIKTEPEKTDLYIKEYAKLLRLIHSTRIDIHDMPNIKPLILSWLETDRPYLSDDVYKKLLKMINEVLDVGYMLHCDYHTNNLMKQGDETLLIDMDTLSYGHPIFELANICCTYVTFGEVDPSFVENFLDLPYDTAKEIWDKFLPLYLQTGNPEKIDAVDKKAKLLAYVRYMRHFARRDSDSEISKKVIEYARGKIEALSDEVSSLVF